MSRAVAITGVGVCSPLGHDVRSHAESIAEGRAAIGPPREVMAQDRCRAPIAEVAPWDGEDRTVYDALPRYVAFAAKASREALASASLPPGGVDLVVVGTCNGPRHRRDRRQGGLVAPAPTIEGDWSATDATAQIAGVVGCGSRTLTVSTACSAGASAVAHGWHLLRCGLAERVLCIGVEEFWHGAQLAFELVRAVSSTGCSPYGRSDGTTMAEGAAAILLEAADAGVGDVDDRALGYVIGVGQSADAFHPALPDPTAEGPFLAVRRALELARRPARIDLVAGHGTGTRANDRMEAKLLALVVDFRRSGCRWGIDTQATATPPAMFSTKNLQGHTVGASGAVGLIELMLALRGELNLAGAAFFDGPYGSWRPGSSDWVGLENSLAMGGMNTSVVVASAPEPPGPSHADRASRAGGGTTVGPRVAIGGVATATPDGIRFHAAAGGSDEIRNPARLRELMEAHARCRRPRWDGFDVVTTLTAYVVAGLLETCLADSPLDRTEIGLFVGTERGPARLWRHFGDAIDAGDVVPQTAVPMISRHSCASSTCELYGLRGPTSVFYVPDLDAAPTLTAAAAALGAAAATALFVVEVDEVDEQAEVAVGVENLGDQLLGQVVRGCLLVGEDLADAVPGARWVEVATGVGTLAELVQARLPAGAG